MDIAPFGVMKLGHQNNRPGLYTPMQDWPNSQDYRALIDSWIAEITAMIWPAWTNGGWYGGSEPNMAERTKAELQIAVNLYHGVQGAEDMLSAMPAIPQPQDGIPRNQEWHYKVEDAEMDHHVYSRSNLLTIPEDTNTIYEHTYEYRVSRNGWANHHLYDPTFDPALFQQLFFNGFRRHAPALFDIKDYFQRPRPWATASLLDVQGFRWTTASGFIHTGIHPSLLSGHCIQGILGGCTVLEHLVSAGGAIDPAQLQAIQKYMVDWGDRRVFAGVHYMTDNIGSWTLARKLIPHLFQNAVEVEALAVDAITQHSRVFRDIVENFPASDSAKMMLLRDFPEGVLVA